MESEKFVKASDVKEYFKRAILGADQKVDKWVDAIPAADVRPVVRGKWVPSDMQDGWITCSVCEKLKFDNRMALSPDLFEEWGLKYCPNCGAVMKVGVENKTWVLKGTEEVGRLDKEAAGILYYQNDMQTANYHTSVEIAGFIPEKEAER